MFSISSSQFQVCGCFSHKCQCYIKFFLKLSFVRFVSRSAPEHRLKILLFCEASLLIFLSFAPAYLLKLWIPVPLVHLQMNLFLYLKCPDLRMSIITSGPFTHFPLFFLHSLLVSSCIELESVAKSRRPSIQYMK